MSIEAMNREFQEWVRKLETGICTTCGRRMTRVQRGFWVYAAPCGHRLYQGQLGRKVPVR